MKANFQITDTCTWMYFSDGNEIHYVSECDKSHTRQRDLTFNLTKQKKPHKYPRNSLKCIDNSQRKCDKKDLCMQACNLIDAPFSSVFPMLSTLQKLSLKQSLIIIIFWVFP